jgi:hypothetical protein
MLLTEPSGPRKIFIRPPATSAINVTETLSIGSSKTFCSPSAMARVVSLCLKTSRTCARWPSFAFGSSIVARLMVDFYSHTPMKSADIGIDKKEYIIKKFTFENHPKFAKEGAHSKNYTFKKKDMSTNPPTETEITIYDYFYTKYGIRLEYPYLPLVQTTRDGVFPMEVCVLLPNQKYQFKLSSEQV